MFKPVDLQLDRFTSLFMLSLPVQAELRCVANAVDIEPFFLRLPLKINNKLNKLSTVA